MDAHQRVIVAVGAGGVGAVDGLLVTVKGTGCLAHVVAGAAEKVVGSHTFVGCAVAVVVTDKGALEGVGTEDGVALVLRVEKEEVVIRLQSLPYGLPHPSPSEGRGEAIGLFVWAPLPSEGLGEAVGEAGAML